LANSGGEKPESGSSWSTAPATSMSKAWDTVGGAINSTRKQRWWRLWRIAGIAGEKRCQSAARRGECRCGKQMRDTTSEEDLKKNPERTYWQCDSRGWRAHKDKGKRIEWFSPDIFRPRQNWGITAPPEQANSTTNYRLKGPRPGGPFSFKTAETSMFFC
jgi:hypothetical protein